MQYKITKPSGKSEKPKATDFVGVHYTLKNLNGEIIESSLQQGKPVEFPLDQVIPGWTEGIQLLSVGDEATLYVPQELAYGDRGGRKVEPYSTLIFEVQLICIGEGCTTKNKNMKTRIIALALAFLCIGGVQVQAQKEEKNQKNQRSTYE